MARADQNTMDIASLVDRSCLVSPLLSLLFFSLFIGFGAGPVTGMSFGRACGARETTSAKFSDQKAGLQFPDPPHFISKRRVLHASGWEKGPRGYN